MLGWIWWSMRKERKTRLENDTDVQDKGELWVLGKQKQEGGGGGGEIERTTGRPQQAEIKKGESITGDLSGAKCSFYNLLCCLRVCRTTAAEVAMRHVVGEREAP